MKQVTPLKLVDMLRDMQISEYKPLIFPVVKLNSVANTLSRLKHKEGLDFTYKTIKDNIYVWRTK